jgi:hypothetical protein
MGANDRVGRGIVLGADPVELDPRATAIEAVDVAYY